MHVKIRITNTPDGNLAFLYEKEGMRGRRARVPTYGMHVVCGSMTESFGVTRDTSTQLFSPSACGDVYATDCECPPSKSGRPFCGSVRTDGRRGFRIELFEPGKGNSYSLVGGGTVPREHIQIHKGPAASRGCFIIGGGAPEHRRFECLLKPLCGREDTTITVAVESRSI